MKALKRTLCLLTALSILLLAACGPKENENNQPTPQSGGRYVENDITPPYEGRFFSFLMADEAIVCLSEGLKQRFESADGGQTWQSAPGPGAQSERYSGVTAVTLLSDGSIVAYAPEEGLVLISPDGTGTPCPVSEIDEAIAKGENVMISLLKAVSDNRLLLSYTIGGMMRVSRSGSAGGNAMNEGSAESGPATQSGGAITGNEPLPNGGPQGTGGEPLPNGGPQGIGGEPSANGGPVTNGGPAAQTQGEGPGGGTSGNVVGSGFTMRTTLYDIAAGKPVAELPTQSAVAADADDTRLYLLEAGGSVKAYSLEDGQPANQSDIRFGEGSDALMMPAMAGISGGALAIGSEGFYAAQNGDVLLATEGGAAQIVLGSTAYSTGAPRSSINAIYALADDSLLINLSVGEGNRLYKFIWDENATLNPDKTLTVWSLEDNTFVRAAIAQLRKSHPDASITYEVALSDGIAELADDAIKTLNTRLLNGSGPDIIILDGCPVDSYVSKGMLMDFGALVDTGDVYGNLLSPYFTDGKLYCMPMQFRMPILMGSADALDKAPTLEALVELVVAGNAAPDAPAPGTDFSGISLEQRSELYFSDLRELSKVLWLASAPGIVSDYTLNTDALKAYLEAVKAISDKYELTSTQQEGRMRMALAFSDGGSVTELPGSLMRYTSQQTNYAAFAAGNLQLLQMVMDRAESDITLFPGLTPGAWEPSTIAGISADTGVPEFAAEFIKAMLHTEVQSLNYGTGLPITQKGIAAQIETINERLIADGRDGFNVDVGAQIEKLQTPSMGDMVLTDMMWSSVEKCCEGKLSVDEAVKEIEQNVKNYLAERA